MERIVIAGAGGFIGSYLQAQFTTSGFEVGRIGRRAGGPGTATWADPESMRRLLDGAAVLINLAGKSVNCRYNARNRAEILRSRVDTTRSLAEALAACERPTALWINAGTATIYRHAEDRPMTESAGEPGGGFSVEVARAWEQAFFERPLPGLRKVVLRIAIVLGPGGGVMTPYRRMVKMGLGGKQGKGSQRFSFIHLADLCGMIRLLMERPDLEGVFNASAPHPVTNRELMHALRARYRMPFGLPAPTWLLRMGAWLIGTETELILKSRWVLPERMEEAGYRFRYPTLPEALAAC